jgi:hypothetical protein
MWLHRVVITAALLMSSTSVATAQSSVQQDKLKRLLEEKYGTARSTGDRDAPRTRGLGGAPAPVPTAPAQSEDVRVIKPDGTIKPLEPGASAAPGRRSDLANGDGLWSRLAAAVLPAAWAQQPIAPPPPQPATIVDKKSIVIQLNPDVTSAQIDALVEKYDLKVTKHVPSLGVLYVEQSEGERLRTRSLTPSGPETLKSVLEPKVIIDLRGEAAVNAAFLNSTIAPKSLPGPSSTRVNQSGANLGWVWDNSKPEDGNWGLKVIRMPAVWTVLERVRKATPNRAPVTLSFLDSGFGTHRQLQYQRVYGSLGVLPPPVSCGSSHGTHVAGISGASQNNGAGIDGIVPAANIDVLPITHELLSEGVTDGTDAAQQHVAYFMDAIAHLGEYFEDHPVGPNERRVVNISLAYNWFGVGLVLQRKPTDDAVIRDQIRQHAKIVQSLVNRHQDRVLFVAASGNDSDGQPKPISAEYASPFAFAALQSGAGPKKPKNIIIIEARGRDGSRAAFSNINGHVAAPGVDIMSTIATKDSGYAVCSGTSQAAPHVTALAGILFELAPTKSPADIIDIITKTAQPPITPGAAPALDALEAVLRVVPDPIVLLRHLADLNGDGKVDAEDLEIFKTHLTAIEAAKTSDEPFTIDLNGDGAIDARERCFPRIDLNGSGRAAYDPSDMRVILGVPRSDLDVMELAWTGPRDFKTVLVESGLPDIINAWKSTSSVRTLPQAGAARPCDNNRQ